MSTKFEIRVAVFGYVSVGKTTLINALFGAEYGQVSMRCTTAVVNYFGIASAETKSKKSCPDGSRNEGEGESLKAVEKQSQLASEILKQSAEDNASNRNSGVVKEKMYHGILLKDSFHKMRDDTQLIIVDIPGLNEAGSSSKYKEYVNQKWHSFDVIIAVMDGHQGVNTDEQLDMLKLIKTNLDSVKNIPTILVCNKVDDPDDKEQQILLAEARGAVENIFGVSCRKHALQQLIADAEESNTKDEYNASLLPAVIPLSARHAFLYRCGTHLSFNEFKNLDPEHIERIGKDSYGRQWGRFSEQKKLEKAFEAVSDEEQRKDGLRASNFDCLLRVIAYCLGNDDRQAAIIRQQVDVSVARIHDVALDCDLSAEIHAAYNTLSKLGAPTVHLRDAFWPALKKLIGNSLSSLGNGASTPKEFARPLTQLASYLHMIRKIGWEDQVAIVAKSAKEIVLRYALKVFEHEKVLSKSPVDTFLVLGSMLLPCSTVFRKHFGFLKLQLDAKYIQVCEAHRNGLCEKCHAPLSTQITGKLDYCNHCGYWINSDATHCPRHNHVKLTNNTPDGKSCNCAHCGYTYIKKMPAVHISLQQLVKYKNGHLVQIDENKRQKIASVVVPDSFEDPDHFGYPIWKACSILEDAGSK